MHTHLIWDLASIFFTQTFLVQLIWERPSLKLIGNDPVQHILKCTEYWRRPIHIFNFHNSRFGAEKKEQVCFNIKPYHQPRSVIFWFLDEKKFNLYGKWQHILQSRGLAQCFTLNDIFVTFNFFVILTFSNTFDDKNNWCLRTCKLATIL